MGGHLRPPSNLGVHVRPAVTMTSTTAVVAVELGTGTQANVRAYAMAVP